MIMFTNSISNLALLGIWAYLLTFLKIDFHELMTTFLKVNRGHDCQINRSPKIDEIGICLILNLHLLLLFYY